MVTTKQQTHTKVQLLMAVRLAVLICLSVGSAAVAAQCDPCPGLGSWDTRNCYVMSAPQGSKAFVYDGNLYVTSPNGQPSGCPPGTAWDTANCHAGAVPSGRQAFVYDNKLYLEPICDPPGPPKRLSITEVKLNAVKSKALDRDDVSWVAALYDNNNCAATVFPSRTSIVKIAKRDVGSWRSVKNDQEITAYPDAYLRPNHTIALMLFDRDSCKCDQEFKYALHCSGKIHGQSKSSPYGYVYLKYRNFLDKDAVVEFDLGGARLRIRSQNIP